MGKGLTWLCGCFADTCHLSLHDLFPPPPLFLKQKVKVIDGDAEKFMI